jgi:hypothetical protein
VKIKEARDLAKGIIVDLDEALANGGERGVEARHSALASAGILAVRLLGGIVINTSRIAKALEDIADKMYEEPEDGGDA